ncbi:MAG: hypothetical protein C0507_13945 [Cyanobacteria bacterium PR.3.49]|nr:hypothetical protein [Cyanobacteria bacterium PR.3.49]
MANKSQKIASIMLASALAAACCVLAKLPGAAAQISFDPVSTFIPLGHNEDRNEHLARTLKNEQDLKFRTRVLGRRGVVLVEFSLPTCPACDPTAKSIIELLSHFGGKVDYIRLDLNKNLGLSYKYDVPEVPAVLVFKNGQLEDRYVTYKADQKNRLAQSLSRLIADPPGSGDGTQLVLKVRPVN